MTDEKREAEDEPEVVNPRYEGAIPEMVGRAAASPQRRSEGRPDRGQSSLTWDRLNRPAFSQGCNSPILDAEQHSGGAVDRPWSGETRCRSSRLQTLPARSRWASLAVPRSPGIYQV